MTYDSLTAVSPIDGRYASKCREFCDIFSEYGLIARRVLVECTWLEALCDAKAIRECKSLSLAERKALRAIAAGFSLADAQRVKDIEKTTNHDVKAVEYFLKEKVKGTSLESRSEFIHFGCTSEDINNMSHALMLRVEVPYGSVHLRRHHKAVDLAGLALQAARHDGKLLADRRGRRRLAVRVGEHGNLCVSLRHRGDCRRNFVHRSAQDLGAVAQH